MTVTSPLYARLHAKEFGLRDDQMLITGNAKTDWLFQNKTDWTDKLSIPIGKKYIFWLPTYRFSEKNGHRVSEQELGRVDICNARSCYPMGKRMAENICYSYFKEYGIPVKTGYAPNTSLRLSGDKLCKLGWKPTQSLLQMYQDVIGEILA